MYGIGDKKTNGGRGKNGDTSKKSVESKGYKLDKNAGTCGNPSTFSHILGQQTCFQILVFNKRCNFNYQCQSCSIVNEWSVQLTHNLDLLCTKNGLPSV